MEQIILNKNEEGIDYYLNQEQHFINKNLDILKQN